MKQSFKHFDEYNARKVGTTPDQMDLRLEAMLKTAPTWFKPILGFRFMFGEGPAIFLGPGGFRDTGDDSKLCFVPPGILITYFYKGEWHFADIHAVTWAWDSCRSMPEES